LAPGPSFTGYAVVTIISDIVTALLPLPVLLKLQVRTSKKIGLVSIFMLGVLTTVASIMRYLQIDRIQHGDGDSTLLVLWGTIEFNIGVSYPPSQLSTSNLTMAERCIIAPIPRPSLHTKSERLSIETLR
jgi:hypothetical protein